MAVINLCEEFENQLVDGIDKHDLTDLLHYEDVDAFDIRDGAILHVPSGKKILLGCVKDYFRPKQEYYRFGKHDRCGYIRRALGVSCRDDECMFCFRQCLKNRLAIRPKKIRVAKDYFTK